MNKKKDDLRFPYFAGLGLSEEEASERILSGLKLGSLSTLAETGRSEAAAHIFRNIVKKLNIEEKLSIFEFQLVIKVLEATVNDKKAALRFINPRAAQLRSKRDSDLAEKIFRTVRKLRGEQGMAVSEDQAFAEVAKKFNMTSRTASRHYYDYKNYRDELIQDMVNHAIDNLGGRLTTAEERDEFEKLPDKMKMTLRQKFIEEQVPNYRETLEGLL